MAANVDLMEMNYSATSGTVKSNGIIRYKQAKDPNVDLNNPMVKPTPGNTLWSFPKYLALWCGYTGPSTGITNCKFWFGAVPAYPAMGIIYTYSLTDVWADPVAGPQYGTAADATHASSTNKVDFSPNGGTFTGSNARIGRFIVTQMLLTENVAAPGMTPLVQHNFSYDEV